MRLLSGAVPIRVGGILVGAAVMFVGGAIIASAPALADNGPHVSNIGQTSIGSGPDGCAGCHRAHSADGQQFLLRGASDETTLCTTCHGTTGTGASTDVLSGMGYDTTARTGTPGALRGGGFDYALIGTGSATRGLNAAGTSTDKTLHVIPAVASGDPNTATTSTHALDVTGTMWGAGALNNGAGSTVTTGSAVALECGSCHDPHGNNSYRILRPAGGLGATLQVSPKAITSVAVSADTYNTGKFIYTYTTSAAHGLMPGQPVSVAGATPAAYNVTGQVVSATPSTTTFSIPNQATDPGALTVEGTMTQAFANNIINMKADAGTITVTTASAHGLVAGQKVTIAGITDAAATAFNLARQTIVAAPSTTTFTIANAATGTYTASVSGGYIQNIADAASYTGTGNVNGKVYTQANFWRADDHYYTGTFNSSTSTKSAFITNISQWCSTCHTRYLASGSNARKFTSGDAIFKFRHTSANGTEGSPNCLQCHVAHGSNAQMTGAFSSSLPEPGSATPSSSSRLLRMDNRGICSMCHAAQ